MASKKNVLFVVLLLLLFVVVFWGSGDNKKHEVEIEFEGGMVECKKTVRDYWSCLAIVLDNISLCNGSVYDVGGCEDEFLYHNLRFGGAEIECESFNLDEFKVYCNVLAGDETCEEFDGVFENALCNVYSTGDLSFCGEDVLDECQDRINKNKAMLTKKAAFCNDILDSYRRLVCLAIVKEDVSLCELAVQDICIVDQDRYYFEEATNKLEGGLCDLIVSEGMNAACLSVINMDVDSCLSINDEAAKLPCILQLGEYLGMPRLCSNLSESGLVDSCYSFLGGP
ncbi:hypothetical protein ACFLZ6_00475 [Nanoarchaeota archaeon]